MTAGCMATAVEEQPRIPSDHWAFQPIARPQPPSVAGAAWVRNPIDNFVLAELEAAGLAPAPEADRAKLLRRLTLDLTGLPPSPEELDAFLADRSPSAYEAAVDRLLDSPRHAEHIARDWLDAARYADSLGFQSDQPSSMWAYREWVIEAFAEDQPFDQFTVEQLAGDLLPDATDQQRIATGFNRNHPITVEGGVIDEEYRQFYSLDRASTVSTVWLGLTFGCARCHDHKYDPLPQRDFYSLLDCFNRVPDRGLGFENGYAPHITARGPLQQKRLAELETRKIELSTVLGEAAWREDQASWERDMLVLPPKNWIPGAPIRAISEGGARMTAGSDGSFTLSGPAPAIDTHDLIIAVPMTGIRAMKIAAAVDRDGNGPGRSYDGKFAVNELSIDQLIPAPGESVDPELIERRAVNILDASSTGTAEGWGAEKAVDGRGKTAWTAMEAGMESVAIFTFETPLGEPGEASTILRLRLAQEDGRQRQLAQYWITFSDHPLAGLNSPLTRTSISVGSGGVRTPLQEKEISDYFLRYFARPELRSAARALLRVERRIQEARELPLTMIMADDPARETFILHRGDFQLPGEKVTCNIPRVLPVMPEDLPRNRLGVARWLMGSTNPLTSRVIANHYFGFIFGEKLVRTPEDFGTRGERPTHPRLLDWMATHLMDSGWKIKPFLKLLVTSATYRQSSRVAPEALAADPENRLLGRAVKRRLPAEVIRDQALFLSQLLVEETGGQSVFPYHPTGLWEELNDNNGAVLHYRHDRGAKLYRRSMYSFWKRTMPQPSMTILDAPSRETAVVHRTISHTALQPLVLLDDPQLVEAARRFADRMRAEGGTDLSDQIRYGFRLATARVPSLEEVSILLQAHRAELEELSGDRRRALAFLTVGEAEYPSSPSREEQAALGHVARIILNLAETVQRE